MASVDIESMRRQLDLADEQVIDALGARFRVVDAIAKIKAKAKGSVPSERRERQVLARVQAHARTVGVDSELVLTMYRHILDHSRVRQSGPRYQDGETSGGIGVAYQGEPGSYSHLASLNHFAGAVHNLEFQGYVTFGEVVDAVQKREMDFGLLPVENTTAGSINEVYDLLATAGLDIVGEQVQTVDHCLLGLPGATVEGLRCIRSHPQALAQCTAFLAKLKHARAEVSDDTALAARLVKETEDPTQAAIASTEAARLYGLDVLAEHVANQPENYTRFVAVARDPLPVGRGIAFKTSIVFDTAHEPGALAGCVATLARHGLNMTKLESRPLPRMPWKYRFYVDFITSDTRAATAALAEMHEHTRSLAILGRYAANVPSTARG